MNWIVAEQTTPGYKLPTDREFSFRFNTSTTAVTNAFKRLADEGIVEKRPRRGTFLRTSLKRPSIVDVYLPAAWREPLLSYDMLHHSYFIYREYLDGITRGGADANVATCVDYIEYETGDEFRLRRSVACDGALMTVTRQRIREELSSLGVPYVSMALFATVALNNQIAANGQGILAGLDTLYELGHRDFGYLSQKIPGSATDRFEQTITEWLSERGLTMREDAVCMAKRPEEQEIFTDNAVSPRIRAFLEQKNRPTAIISSSPVFTRPLVRHAEDMGLRIPEDLSVLHIGTPKAIRLLNRSLAVADLRFFDVAYQAMVTLSRMCEDGHNNTDPVLLDSLFIPGNSLAPPGGP